MSDSDQTPNSEPSDQAPTPPPSGSQTPWWAEPPAPQTQQPAAPQTPQTPPPSQPPSWTTPAAPPAWSAPSAGQTPAGPTGPTWSAQSEPTQHPWSPEPPTRPNPPTQATPAAESWPPRPSQPQPGQPSPWGPQSQSSWPPQGPATPPTGSSAGGSWGGGGWSGPPGPPPTWPPEQPQQPGMSPGKRALAAVAAVLLVLASAGVGAAVATAVHKNPSNQQSIGSTSPFGNGSGSGNGFGGFGGFGNGSNGSGSSGTGSNGSGSSGNGSSSTGTLDANAIAAKVSPALVNINTTLSDGRAAGTGIIISSSGEVLTNNHVIADATSIKVDIGGTGNTHDAQVIGYDVTDDVALVQIQGVSNLKTVDLGDPSKLNVGDPVVAIGNALGEGGAPKVSQGKVTGLDQQVTAGDPSGGTTETLQHMIQIDAPIQPGDSGGALVNSQGQVVGMNTAAAGTGGRFTQQSGSNVGFAIPVSSAIQVIRQIQSGNGSGNVHIGSSRALLGVNVADPSQGGDANCSSSSTNGALVVGVQGSSAASAAGLQECDTITSLDGKSIADQNALHMALTNYNPGDKVTVGWTDTSGNTHSASVTLGSGPPA